MIDETLKCDMCGGALSSDGVCSECGMKFSDGEFQIGNPEWGKISIKLDYSHWSREEVIAKIIEIVSELELNTSQRLFPNQIGTVNGDVLELIGPKESFMTLSRRMEEYMSLPDGWIFFSPMSSEEVYYLRDNIRLSNS